MVIYYFTFVETNIVNQKCAKIIEDLILFFLNLDKNTVQPYV